VTDGDPAGHEPHLAGGVVIPDDADDRHGPDAGATARDGVAVEVRPEASDSLGLRGAVGRGSRNDPADVQIVQEALNRRLDAGLKATGKCDAKTLKAIEEFQRALGQRRPDGVIQPGRGTARALVGSGRLPPPPEAPKPLAPPKLGEPTLARAPLVWKSTRGILQTNIEELKKGVRGQYGTEHPDLLVEIERGMGRLSRVLEHLDESLVDALDQANAAADKPNRDTALKGARAILARYIDYVKSEPMIALMDDNPFDVKTSLREIITDSLNHLAKAMG